MGTQKNSTTGQNMALRNSDTQYGAGSKIFHWVLAIMLLGMYAFGTYLQNVEFTPDKIGDQIRLIGIHKSVGTTILALVILRLLWRLINPQPPLPEDTPKIERFAAHAVHGILYLAMFALPITGWIYSSLAGFPVSVFGLFTLPDLVPVNKDLTDLFHSIHGFCGDVLIVAFAIHVGAALFHHYYRKDTILLRMLPFAKVEK